MEAPINNSAREQLWECIPRFFKSTSNLPHLPIDVVTEILSRLPLKTVVAAKCVCKSWLNLVSGDTHLAKLHRQRSATTELLLRLGSAHSKTLYLGNPQFHNDRVNDVKLSILFNIWEKTEWKHLIFDNSCNGLLCFHTFDSNYAVIINPITRDFITVPKSTKWRRSIPIVNYMLGFSEKKNRFKLLQVMYRAGSSKQFADICTFEKGSKWRDVRDCHYPIPRIVESESVFLAQKLHYGFVGSGDTFNGIACFDFENEQFGVVPIPSSQNFYALNSLFGVFRGCLSVSWRSPDTIRYEIWAMKEYGVEDSWEKLFSIPDMFLVPLKQLDNGEILMLSYIHRYLVSYNPSSDMTSLIKGFNALGVSAYSPSLLRLKDALAGYEACIRDVNSRRRNLRHPKDQNTLKKLNRRTRKRRLKS